jgi:hypothetical protein
MLGPGALYLLEGSTVSFPGGGLRWSIGETGLELKILLPQPPEWCAPQCWVPLDFKDSRRPRLDRMYSKPALFMDLLHMVFTKYSQKIINFKKKFQKQKF